MEPRDILERRADVAREDVDDILRVAVAMQGQEDSSYGDGLVSSTIRPELLDAAIRQVSQQRQEDVDNGGAHAWSASGPSGNEPIYTYDTFSSSYTAPTESNTGISDMLLFVMSGLAGLALLGIGLTVLWGAAGLWQARADADSARSSLVTALDRHQAAVEDVLAGPSRLGEPSVAALRDVSQSLESRISEARRLDDSVGESNGAIPQAVQVTSEQINRAKGSYTDAQNAWLDLTHSFPARLALACRLAKREAP